MGARGGEQVVVVDSAAVLPLDGLLHPGEQLAGGGRIDLIAGEVWAQAVFDYAIEAGEIDDDDEDPGRWLWADCEGSCPGYRDMQAFICDLDDAHAAERVSDAISGRGAFRRFTDTLSAWPDLMARWYAFSPRAWLSDVGYAASPATPGGLGSVVP